MREICKRNKHLAKKDWELWLVGRILAEAGKCKEILNHRMSSEPIQGMDGDFWGDGMRWTDLFSSEGFGLWVCLVESCSEISRKRGPLDFNFRVGRLVTLGSLNPSNQVNVLAAKKYTNKNFP